MKTFDELWQFIEQRLKDGIVTVQDRTELEHVYNLMRDCECGSYLEVGAAEGNSLYVLGQVVNGQIDIVDLGEAHTAKPRAEVISLLNKSVQQFLGDSTYPETYFGKIVGARYDCILIDGGHDYTTVLSDAIQYAPLARKYVFFHDIQLPEVRAAVEWFVKRWKLGTYSMFINSSSFGYGIIKIER